MAKMNRAAIISSINVELEKLIYQLDIEGDLGCEFAGCDRKASIMVEEPPRKYGQRYSFSCRFHVTYVTLQLAAKYVEHLLDEYYCPVCERTAHVCECQREDTGELEVAKLCSVCGGEGEHNWEVHVGEMRASLYEQDEHGPPDSQYFNVD